jgi:nucleoside 2-deoxyribosyltransferase
MKNIISICGSMQLFEEMQLLQADLRRQGFDVFLPEAEEGENFYATLPEAEKPAMKKHFIDAHLRKIRESDAVLIANYPRRGVKGYVGPNTLIEIAFAYALGKPIYLLHRMGEQPCKDEVDGLAPTVLNHDLSRITRRAG